MAFTEVTTFNINREPCIPFGLSRAADHNLFAVCCRRSVQIIELDYSHHYDGTLNFRQSFADDPSAFIPSKQLKKDAAAVYKAANAAQRRDLIIDPHLMSEELRVDQPAIALISARWSPQSKCQQYYLACLTNFGGCEIRGVNKAIRKWDVVVCDVSKHWSHHCGRVDTIRTFDELKSQWLGLRLSAVSWTATRSSGHLSFATISCAGHVAFHELNADSIMRTAFEWNTELPEANLLEWITFDTTNGSTKSFVVVGDVRGNVTLLDVRIDKRTMDVCGVGDQRKLFSEDDGVRANGIHWEYHDDTDRLMVCLCKGMHFFAFLLSGDGVLRSHRVHYVGHLMITGIYRQSKLEYVVGATTGHIECIRLAIDDATDSITVTSIVRQNPIYKSQCSLYGLATSTNNAFTLMAQYVNVPFDHLVIREPACVMVCQHMGAAGLARMLENHTWKLTHAHDLAELVRCTQELHDDAYQTYLSNWPEDTCVTDAFLYELKVRLIVTSARSTYLRQKYRLKESNQLLGEYEILRRIVFVIWAIRSLEHLSERNEPLTQFQMEAAQGLRAFLQVFLEMEAASVCEALTKRFRPMVELLLVKTSDLDGVVPVSCVYCDLPIEAGRLVCADSHDMPRCFVTQVQVPLINQRYCSRCQITALDDLNLIRQVMDDDELDAICCPLCDVEIGLIEQSELFV